MARAVHKYMPVEMSLEERLETFAARQHTLDYLIKFVREQIGAQSLNSVLITGPRGAGKTTLVLMLQHALEADDELRAAWLPVHFPEELPSVSSLRDLFAEALRLLAEAGTPQARDWYDKAEAEALADQSLEIATTGLREISRTNGRRLVFLIENLDMVFDRSFDEMEEAHLRRLLMSDPFFLIVGTTVRLFPEVTDYDRAFFNYFKEVPLERLTDTQVEEFLTKRADYHHNHTFQQNFRKNRSSVQAITRLTGGNPRLITMLYEVLSQREVQSVVALLRQIIDELTPLLKDVLERLPPQQAKVFDAIMRLGGTAQPSDLVAPARMSLNVVTTMLKRLRDAQMVEVSGGGKGRKAYYTVPDQLFCTWYQMRYVRPNRRRIEIIVEFLRVCFDEKERVAHLRDLERRAIGPDHITALNAEYFAASLAGSANEGYAQEVAVHSWMKLGQVREAAFTLAELAPGSEQSANERPSDQDAQEALGLWCLERNEWQNAIEAFNSALDCQPENAGIKLNLAYALALSGAEAEAVELWSEIAASSRAPVDQVAKSLFNRGVAKGNQGDMAGEMADYTAVVSLEGAPAEAKSRARFKRGVILLEQRRLPEVREAFAQAASEPDLTAEEISKLLGIVVRRWVGAEEQGDEVLSNLALALLKRIDSPEQAEAVLRALFSKLAKPKGERRWLLAWDTMQALTNVQLAFFDALRPVADFLRNPDDSLLERLPTDQRVLADSLLENFKISESGETSPEVSRDQVD